MIGNLTVNEYEANKRMIVIHSFIPSLRGSLTEDFPGQFVAWLSSYFVSIYQCHGQGLGPFSGRWRVTAGRHEEAMIGPFLCHRSV
jgi:hypothetical protein